MLKRLVAGLAALALSFGGMVQAANLTPDQLTQATTANDPDLFILYPTGGPMKSVQWSVMKSLMTTALGSSFLRVTNNLNDLASPSSARTNLGLGSAALANTSTTGHALGFLDTANTWGATQLWIPGTTTIAPMKFTAGTNLSTPIAGSIEWDGTNLFATQTTGPTRKTLAYTDGSITGSAAKLTTGRTLAITGDLAWTSPSFDGSTNVAAAGVLATVNSNVGSFTNANITVNAKGLVTAASNGSPGGVTSFNTRTGAVTLSSGDVTGALGFAPANNASPAFTGSTPTSGGTALVLTTDSRFGGPTQRSFTNTNYAITGVDAGGQVIRIGPDATSRTITVPSNASIPFPIGTKIEIVNGCTVGTLVIAITTDGLVWSPSGASGSRTMSGCAQVTLTKILATTWFVTGTGLSANTLDRPRWMPANDSAVLPDLAA